MHNISTALKNHLAQETTTTCNLWKITRQDGLVIGYTDFVKDITYQDVRYSSITGFNQSAIKTNLSLSVDNLELKGPLRVSTSIADIDLTNEVMMSDADINAGLWDYAIVDYWLVNYEDLSMGHFIRKSGNIGQITTGRNSYTAEFRGIQQPLQQTIGRPYTPSCLANLGDSNCRVNMASYTFNGSVISLIDQHSWIDTSLNQSNSTYVKTISNITKQNPIRITSTAHGLSSGEKITFSEITGMTQLNGLTLPITYVDANTFTVAIDGTVFSDYVSGGKITKSIISEYFKDGYVEWLTGLNTGLKAGIKTYRPNYVFLHDEMIFDIQVGDTYKIVAGCDKLHPTCHTRFNNIINFYGFNLVPGQDRLGSGT